MTDHTETIDVDKATADTLRARAAERGISVAQLLAEVARESGAVAANAADIAELDRRWAKVATGDATVPHDDVVRWLNTWGTSTFKPLRDQ